MRKVLALLVVLFVALALMTSIAFAGGNVVATFTVADLGQGIWGGGSLFEDGTASGHIPFSAANGQLIFHIHPTSWSWIVPGALLELCFDTHVIKNTIGASPPAPACAVLPVTGTPVLVDVNGDGNPDFVLRATLAN